MSEILRFVWESDDLCHVYLNGEHIVDMDHDVHGRDGMDGIGNALLNVAEALRWNVIIVGKPGI